MPKCLVCIFPLNYTSSWQSYLKVIQRMNNSMHSGMQNDLGSFILMWLVVPSEPVSEQCFQLILGFLFSKSGTNTPVRFIVQKIQ